LIFENSSDLKIPLLKAEPFLESEYCCKYFSPNQTNYKLKHFLSI